MTIYCGNVSFSLMSEIDWDSIDPELLVSKPIEKIHMDSLAVMKIVNHSRDYFPLPAAGVLLGIDINGVLEITNSYCSIPEGDVDQDDDASPEDLEKTMLANLAELGFDAQKVGCYRSIHMGSYWNQDLIETQLACQKKYPQAVLILHEQAKVADSGLQLVALRLTAPFIAFFEARKFTMAAMSENYSDISAVFETVPIVVQKSQLLTAVCDKINSSSVNKLSPFLASPLVPQVLPTAAAYDSFNISADTFISKNLENLADAIEEHGQEQWRWRGWQRNLQNEQAKAQQYVTKLSAENKAAIEAGNRPLVQQGELNMVSTPALQKAIQNEPSRLESLLIVNQIETYCAQLCDMAGPAAYNAAISAIAK